MHTERRASEDEGTVACTQRGTYPFCRRAPLQANLVFLRSDCSTVYERDAPDFALGGPWILTHASGWYRQETPGPFESNIYKPTMQLNGTRPKQYVSLGKPKVCVVCTKTLHVFECACCEKPSPRLFYRLETLGAGFRGWVFPSRASRG